ASAASVAGLLKLKKENYFRRVTKSPSHQVTRITCILTGHGLKDPDRAIKSIKEPKIVKPNLKAILKEIGY
ncbi:MAG: threonine synthase, partial [Candidatus Omnitrophica bacterium]|nr:threonine synthase [Candidatus Omnitrophota bacterium]